jgi:hypothetical protein
VVGGAAGAVNRGDSSCRGLQATRGPGPTAAAACTTSVAGDSRQASLGILSLGEGEEKLIQRMVFCYIMNDCVSLSVCNVMCVSSRIISGCCDWWVDRVGCVREFPGTEASTRSVGKHHDCVVDIML